jgi:hypothetical protein
LCFGYNDACAAPLARLAAAALVKEDCTSYRSNVASTGRLGIAMRESWMNTFDKRGEGFENKFAHEEERRFKAAARRNKLLGQWAAEKLGLADAEALAYARAVVSADFEEPGDEDVFRKIRKDFDAAGLVQSDHQIRRTMDELLGQAATEIHEGR